MGLQPTLWRTCRSLANRRRLACLKTILMCPGETVGALAEMTGLPPDQASLCLRSLQARGLLRASRESRWVRYYPDPDPLVPMAASLLSGIRQALLRKDAGDASLIHCLTAFTHPRRLLILRVLQREQSISFAALMAKTRISCPALLRHLRKLAERKLVSENESGWMIDPEHPRLADTFLALLADCEP